MHLMRLLDVGKLKFCSTLAGSSGFEDGLKHLKRSTLDGLRNLGSVTIHLASPICASALNECGELACGRHVESLIVKHGFGGDTYIGNLVVQMYGNCGSTEDAFLAFQRIDHPNVYSWNIMLSAYTKNGQMSEARDTFEKMPIRNAVTCSTMIVAYSQNGWCLDARIIFEGMPEWNIMSCSAILAAYAEEGHIQDSWNVFLNMPERNMVSWNSILAAYSYQTGNLLDAKELFFKMPFHSVVSWTTMLVINSRHGNFEEALDVFINMPERNVISWNSMLATYAQHGYVDEASRSLEKMSETSNASINTILTAYARNRYLSKAKSLFDVMHQRTAVTWNTLLVGFAQSRNLLGTRNIFDMMPQQSPVSWSIMISAYASGNFEIGQELLEKMPLYDVAAMNSLITAYGMLGSVTKARETFERMLQRNLVSWTTMITAYAHNGEAKQAFYIFRWMDLEGYRPDKVAFISIVDVCTTLVALKDGKNIHAIMVNSKLDFDISVYNALLNMYAKCGGLFTARKIFDEMQERNILSWSAMISGYSQNGINNEALHLFHAMLVDGLRPDNIIFVTVLSALSHGGQLKDGRDLFISLHNDFTIIPNASHFVCMLDLLGRAGRLSAAMELINNMPYDPDVTAWTTVLCCCKMHKNVAMAQRCASEILKLSPHDVVSHVTISDMYKDLRERIFVA